MKSLWLETVAWVALGCAGAVAAEAPRLQFNLPAQRMTDTLNAIAEKSNLRIIYFSADTSKLSAPAVNGSLTAEAALKAALANSGLKYRFKDEKTVQIRAVSAAVDGQERSDSASISRADAGLVLAQLPVAEAGPAPSSAQGLDDDQQEVVVTAAKIEGLSATRVPTALKDIPQSVSVVDQETIQQQNAHSLGDVLDRATGISMVHTDTLHTSFIARGFSVTKFHIDGGSPISLGGTISISPTDLAQFDHVEILRGADALFGGNGNPGATVNLARKRPGTGRALTTTASFGSWNDYRLEADVTGPIAAQGALRGRAVLVDDRSDFFFDVAEARRKKLYGILEYDLSQGTMLTVGGSFEQNNQVPFAVGLPRFANGDDPRLSRSTAFAVPWGKADTRTREGFLQLDHRFNDSWKVKFSGTALDQSSDSRNISLSSTINPVTGLMDGFLVIPVGDHEGKHFSMDMTLTGGFEWFGRRHEVLVGADFGSIHDVNISSAFVLSGSPIDPYAFDPGAYPVPVDDPNDPNDDPYGPGIDDITIRQSGGYASVRFHPSDRLALIGGGRYSIIEYSTPASSGIQLANKYSGKITPYAGVVYDLGEQYSIYASYADIYDGNPNGLIDGPGGAPLPPSNGINLEAGLKAAWWEGRLNGSLAVFKIDQEGVPLNYSVPGASFPCCYRGATNKSRGIETELSGMLAPGWTMTAGYTYNRKNTNTRGAVLSTRTPKHLFKLWTSYRLPGELHLWNIGGGLNAQSGNYVGGSGCTQFDALGNCTGPFVRFDITQDSYAVATVRVAYDMNPGWSLALNVENVMDKTYFQTIGGTTGNNFYGEPRNFLLKIQGRF